MTLLDILFILTALLALVGAVGLITARNPVHCALFLLLNFGSFAIIYLLLTAYLVAVLQILIYAGAIVVLFVFVVMYFYTPADVPRESPALLRTQNVLGIFAALIFLVEILFFLFMNLGGESGFEWRRMFIMGKPDQYTPETIVAYGGNPSVVGQLLFTKYLYQFELTSVILLVAIVGAVFLGRRKSKRGHEELVK